MIAAHLESVGASDAACSVREFAAKNKVCPSLSSHLVLHFSFFVSVICESATSPIFFLFFLFFILFFFSFFFKKFFFNFPLSCATRRD